MAPSGMTVALLLVLLMVKKWPARLHDRLGKSLRWRAWWFTRRC